MMLKCGQKGTKKTEKGRSKKLSINNFRQSRCAVTHFGVFFFFCSLFFVCLFVCFFFFFFFCCFFFFFFFFFFLVLVFFGGVVCFFVVVLCVFVFWRLFVAFSSLRE
eukprot:Rhum_TRINITY_DN14345_c15_g12::Rhum_TRINITY_DN14345_c15_g12_i1::g.84794::m.84794